MTRGLYKFYWDCGRMGWLDGLFIAEDIDVESAIGRRVDFREALGKHSEIYGILEECDITLISTDQALISGLLASVGHATICGRNPFNYLIEPEA